MRPRYCRSADARMRMQNALLFGGALPYKSDGNAWAVLKLQILASLFGMETVLAGFVWTGGQMEGEKFLFCNKNGYVDWALLGSLT